MGKARRIVLETRNFEKVGDASAFFSKMLRSYDLGDHVTESDAKDLRALLKRHDEVEEKTGLGIDYFEINLPPAEFPKHSDRCFWVVRTDGTRIDFSIKHCLLAQPYD